MLLNVRDWLAKKRQDQWKQSFPIERVFADRADRSGCGPVEAELQGSASAGLVDVSGLLNVRVEFVCSRCLSPFCREFAVPFRESFTRESERIDEERDDLHLVQDDEVDLQPYVEQSVLLAMPYVPVCKEDCLGLTTAGINRNMNPEAVDEVPIDPRLAALADWFAQKKT